MGMLRTGAQARGATVISCRLQASHRTFVGGTVDGSGTDAAFRLRMLRRRRQNAATASAATTAAADRPTSSQPHHSTLLPLSLPLLLPPLPAAGNQIDELRPISSTTTAVECISKDVTRIQGVRHSDTLRPEHAGPVLSGQVPQECAFGC